MAEPKGMWSKEQVERIEKWLVEKWGAQRKCTQCDAFQWHIAEPGTIPLGTLDGGVVLGTGFPAVVVVCANCGHFVLISAFICGALVKPPEEEGGNG